MTGGARRDDAWERDDGAWTAAYGIVLAATLSVIQIEPPPTLAGRIIASSALLAMVPWYMLVGRAVLGGRNQSTARAVIYLAGLGALFAIAASQTAQSSFIRLRRPAPSSPPPIAKRECWPNGNGCPARSMTLSPRASPASSC